MKQHFVRAMLPVRLGLVVAVASLVAVAAGAQEARITGRVVDAAERGVIPAAQVIVTGTTIGMNTSDSGTFSFRVPADAKTMTIRRIGYLAQTVTITPGKTDYTIALTKDVLRLETHGFAGVASSAGPAKTLGSFASFNRILAAKAYLELAYAIVRNPGGDLSARPGLNSAGSPDGPSLATALARLNASAMWDPTGASLAPNTPGSFSADSRNVMWDFSAQSGDQVNTIQGSIGTIAQLKDMVADVDTINDLRWKAKFIVNPVIAAGGQVQAATYSPVASQYIYAMSLSPSSTIPLTREETITLWAAQIQMALGNYTQALAYVNNVRTIVGGLPPLPASVASSYVPMRNALMKEQRISTTWEFSLDRTIAIRMYGLAKYADTTWTNPGGGTEDGSVHVTDSHTTVEPVPSSELSGRGGTYTPQCS